MQLWERIILNSEMADARAIFNSAMETSLLELERLGMSRVLRDDKVKAIPTLASGQDLLAVTRPIFSPLFAFQHTLSPAKHSRARRNRLHCRLWCTWFNVTVTNRCNLQYIGETKRRLKDKDVTNTDVQSTKLTLNLNPLLFLNTFSLTLTILILTCS